MCSGASGNATPLNCRALLHYYFAAAGNSSFAQLALGYRHAHGLGVPKSCQSAVGGCLSMQAGVHGIGRSCCAMSAVRKCMGMNSAAS